MSSDLIWYVHLTWYRGSTFPKVYLTGSRPDSILAPWTDGPERKPILWTTVSVETARILAKVLWNRSFPH